MNRRHFVTAATFVLLGIVGLGMSGCSKEGQTPAHAAETVDNVSVLVVHKETVPDWLQAVGTVRAARTGEVASQMMGTIRDLRCKEGDRVEEGQILATIDDSQPRNAVDQAAAAVTAADKEVVAADSDLALAGSTLKRYQQLFDKKSASPQEFDEIKAREQSAEARRDMARAAQAQANAALAQAHTSLSYAVIHAPFAGVVTEKKAETGTLASPGMALFTIEDSRNYRLEVTVDEDDIRSVRPGQRASVSLDALGNTEISAKVDQIMPAADSASRSFLVKIGLPPNARLRSGLFGRARFSRGTHPALIIPQTSIITRGQLQGVYTVDASGMLALSYVTLGNPIGPGVEVLSGLQDGQTIVASPGTRELGGKQIVLHK